MHTIEARTFHEIANVFPLMTDAELNDLAHDIAAHGLRVPILLHADGRILDGRNRYRACERAHTLPRFETWNGEGSIVDLVITLNLKRRHLTPSQCGLAAARLERFTHGGDRQHAENATTSSNGPHGPLSKVTAGKLLNVGHQTVGRGRRVLDHGTPTLIAAVERGAVTVAAAADVTRLPAAEQDALVEAGTVPQAAEAFRKSRRHVPRGARNNSRTRDGQREQLARLADLAATGHDSKQIAAVIGRRVETVRALLRRYHIDCPGDRTRGTQHHHKADRIVTELVLAAEHVMAGTELIDFAQLTSDKLADWIATLEPARDALSTFIRRLKTKKERDDHEAA